MALLWNPTLTEQLCTAVKINNEAQVRALSAAGACPHARTAIGLNAWYYACHVSWEMRALLESFPRLCDDARFSSDDALHVSLFTACAVGHVASVRAILALHGNDAAVLNGQHENGATSLFVACFFGNTACMAALLEGGNLVDVNLQHNIGSSPLYIACNLGRAECVAVLLDKAGDRVDVNMVNDYGNSPLLIACHQGKADCVALLLEKASDRINVNLVNNKGNSPLFIACNQGKTECVAVLLDKAGDRVDVNLANNDGDSPLFTACNLGRAECVAVLLDKAGDRVDVNLANKIGYSPLFTACHLNRVACVTHLLDKVGDRLDVNHRDTVYQSIPLHYLYLHGLTDLSLRLLHMGADCNIKDFRGRTPDKLSSSKGHKVLSKQVVEYEMHRRMVVLIVACRRRRVLWLPSELWEMVLTQFILYRQTPIS